MDMTPNQKFLASKLVFKATALIAKHQRQCLKRGEISADSIWTLSDLKDRIWKDFVSNDKFKDFVEPFKGKSKATILKGLEEMFLGKTPYSKQFLAGLKVYAEHLMNVASSLSSDVKKKKLNKLRKEISKFRKDIKSELNKKPAKAPSKKQIEKEVTQKLKRFHRNWQNASRSDWEKRYRVTYQVMLEMSPKWKYDVIKSEPNDKLSVELSKRVVSTVDDSYEFAKFMDEVARFKQLSENLKIEVLAIANLASEPRKSVDKSPPDNQDTISDW